jgi:predicted nucleotidyltransferase
LLDKVRKQNQRDIVASFVERLKNQEGENLLEVVLFGSVARGEETLESDVDVCVLLKNSDPERKNAIMTLACDLFDESFYEIAISPIIYTEDYLHAHTTGLMINIAKEGILLYEQVSEQETA